MTLIVIPSDPNEPARWPGHALFFAAPICQQTDIHFGRGVTRSYDIAAISCGECRQVIADGNAMLPPGTAHMEDSANER